MARPNVVLIVADQWRGDALSCAGHSVVETPFLDELAGRGVRFERAYSATPSCVPARAALLTGMSQTSTKRVGYQDGVPFDYPVTIASEFTKAGYQTQAVGKMHVYPERSQMGFQNVVLHDGFLHFARRKPKDIGLVDDYIVWLREKTGNPLADYFDHGVNCNSQVARPWDKDEALHPTAWLTTEAIDFLRRRDPTKPFFLYMGFHRPHPPYDPPQWAFDQYIDAEMPDPPVGDWAEEVLAPYEDGWRADPSVAALSPRALRRARAGYYGHMSHIDLQINRFVEALGDYGLLQDTVIMFTSDHGELLGDHNAFRKSLPYEGSARIPMILAGPGVPRRQVESRIVELRDVMPTLLQLAGIEPSEGIDGIDALSPAAKRDILHGEHTYAGQSVHYLVDGKMKYIWWSGTGREQLFDLQSDPCECHDLGNTPQIVFYRERLVAELTGRPEGFVQDGRLVAGRPVSAMLP